MWKITMVLMLRALLDDLDCSKYTDDRLKQLLTIGAYNVLAEAAFGIDYNINIPQQNISPDPVENDDIDFSTLAVYKTACIMLASEAKTQANNAIAIKDGPSSIDLRGITIQLREAQKDICKQYADLLDKYRYENSVTGSAVLGEAILGPYSPGSLSLGSASMLDYYNGLRQGNFF